MSDQTQPPHPKHQRWEENPSEEWIYALEHMNTGQYELAIKHCQRAIEIWPDYYNAWLLMASALEKLDRLDEALEAVQRASEIAIEELSQAWNNQAFLHVARGEYQDALTVDRVLDLVDPTRHGIARYRMGIAHAIGQRGRGAGLSDRRVPLPARLARARHTRTPVGGDTRTNPEARPAGVRRHPTTYPRMTESKQAALSGPPVRLSGVFFGWLGHLGRRGYHAFENALKRHRMAANAACRKEIAVTVPGIV